MRSCSLECLVCLLLRNVNSVGASYLLERFGCKRGVGLWLNHLRRFNYKTRIFEEWPVHLEDYRVSGREGISWIEIQCHCSIARFALSGNNDQFTHSISSLKHYEMIQGLCSLERTA